MSRAAVLAARAALRGQRPAVQLQRSGRRSASGQKGDPSSELQQFGKAFSEIFEATVESGRVGLNEVLRTSLGMELKKAKPSDGTPAAPPSGDAGATSSRNTDTRKVPSGFDSFFWNPYAEGSPFRDRKKYIEQYKQQAADPSRSAWACNATELVSEEEIRSYVENLVDDGVLRHLSGIASLLVPKTLYANVVKVSIHVFQVAFGALDGRLVLGRQLHLLKDRSWRSQWRVSSRYSVDSEIVSKLVRRIMADHPLGPDIMASEVQRQMYENIVTLVFRLAFDLIDSCQLRVLGHSLTFNIEADEGIAEAPGWDIPLEQGIFGQFGMDEKREFVEDFVDELLTDESINIVAMPDVLERQLYIRVVLLLFDLLETACNHLRLHIAGIAIRPALEELSKR